MATPLSCRTGLLVSLAALAVALSAAALVACGGVTQSPLLTTPLDAGALPDADLSACQANAASECALETRCNPSGLVTDYGDGGTCVAREMVSCADALLAPHNGNTPAHMTSCAAARASETCEQDLDLRPPMACVQVTGPGATGSACSHAGQCTSGFCAVAPQATCGTCQAAPSAGDSCLDLSTCGQTLDCYKGKCIAYTTTIGGSCSESQLCGAGLDCVGASDAGTSGSCRASGTMVGQRCDPSQKASAGCDTQMGLYCASDVSLPTYGTCQAVAYAASGMPCGHVNGVETLCTLGNCFSIAGAAAQCVGRAADDAPCNSVTGPNCMSPSRCTGKAIDGGTSGMCTRPDPVGCP